MSITGSATSPMLASSAPNFEPSPLVSPTQSDFPPRFGLGRKPKSSPTSDAPPASDPVGRTKGFALLRTRTSSPDRFTFPLRPRPASCASTSSLKRSCEGNASSISGSSDSHPLSATSYSEEVPVVIPPPEADLSKSVFARRSFSGGKPKPAKDKHGKKESSGECVIS